MSSIDAWHDGLGDFSLASESCQSDYLSDYSPGDKPWDLRRKTADDLSRAFAALASEDERMAKYAARIWDCSGRLLFRWDELPDGSSALRLSFAQFCRVRLCPVCMWRRSLMWISRLFSALPALLAAHQGARWIHLTLTVKNPEISDLSSTLDVMGKAWHRLSRRRDLRYVLGWVRSIEVTRGEDGPTKCHPHYHVLLFVSPAYFKGDGYISQKGWRDLWRESMRLDYDPVVHVKAVTAKRSEKSGASERYSVPDGLDPAAWSAAVSGGLEVFKYATKPLDLIGGGTGADPWLLGLAQALHKRRLVAAGGVLKAFLAEDETDEELIHGSDGPAESPDDGARVAFAVPAVAGAKPRRYRRAPKFDKSS